MRVLISGGGTGGHVYPALAVVAQLAKVAAAAPLAANPSDHPPQPSVLWVGSTGRMEQALVERAGVPFRGIDTGQVRGINPLTALNNAAKMVRGLRQSLAILDELQPSVCLVTGGYVCAPVVMACRWRRVPVLIYLPDIVPGWAIRALSRLAQRVAVSMPAAAVHFGGEAPQGKAIVTGYPVREELLAVTGHGRLSALAHTENRAQQRRILAERLHRPLAAAAPDGRPLPLLLAWGASQGSRNINQVIWSLLPQLLPQAQVLHIIGERDWPLFQARAGVQGEATQWHERYHPAPYLHEEMALALAAADLTVARAGASILGEFPIARLPSIVAPLLGVNQLQNAQQLVARGAARMVEDSRLAEQLPPVLLELLHSPERRASMEVALAQMAQPEASLKIAQTLQTLVTTPDPRRAIGAALSLIGDA
jgi:UDP-N-acetylglucosamine--N-acetylmuramyl-(pentapeptide) pyrophosphoryl-undecaprenol N-acetylglucosamine transferase